MTALRPVLAPLRPADGPGCNVRSPGQTGSGWPRVDPTQMTQSGHSGGLTHPCALNLSQVIKALGLAVRPVFLPEAQEVIE